MTKHITHEPQDTDAWVCVCGNTPFGDGFCPINEEGRQVEPTEKEWTTNQYCCMSCGRVIDRDTLEVIRQLDPNVVVTVA